MLKSVRAAMRKGLSRIEMLGGAVILVAAAGFLVPMLSSALKQGQKVSGAINMAEIGRSIRTYEQLQGVAPDQWDSLTDSDGNLVSYLPGTTDLLPAAELSDTEVKALNTAGIRNVHLMQAPAAEPWSPTVNPYATPLPSPGTPIDTTTRLALLDPNAARDKLGVSPTGKYVLLGLGRRCTMIGEVVTEPPVHQSDKPALDSATAYARFVTVWKVSDSAAAKPLAKAKYVSTIVIQDDGIATGDSHLKGQENETKAD